MRRKDLFGTQEASPYDVLKPYDYLLVDINNLAYRAYYATSLNNSAGESTSIFHIPLKILYSMIQTMQPKGVALCWDSISGYWRKVIYPEYKATRQSKGTDFYKMFANLYWLCDYLGFEQVMSSGYEADDWVAYLSATHDNCAILSGDRDLFQLINNSRNNCIVYPDKENKALIVNELLAEEMFIQPNLVALFKSIAGDTSDNIKGIPGVGDKGARKALEYADLFEWLLKKNDLEFPSFFGGASVKLINKVTNYKSVARQCFNIVDLSTDHSPEDFDLFDMEIPVRRVDDFEEFLVGNGLNDILDIKDNFQIILSRLNKLNIGDAE